jgi:hypothetical protein
MRAYSSVKIIIEKNRKIKILRKILKIIIKIILLFN